MAEDTKTIFDGAGDDEQEPTNAAMGDGGKERDDE